MQIKGYTLDNHEKVKRAIKGVIGREGRLVKGVGQDASDEVKLAAYDLLGGLILNKEGRKVKTGCFADIEESKAKDKPVPVKDPKVLLQFTVRDAQGNAHIVEVEEGKEPPMEVKVEEKFQKEEREKIAKEFKKNDLRKLARKHKVKILQRDTENEIIEKLLEAGVELDA